MSESNGFAWNRLAQGARGAWREVAEMLVLRRQLAEAEIRRDMATVRRLAYYGGAGLVLALAGVPIVMTAAALQLEAWLQTTSHWPLATVGAAAAAAGLLTLWLAWRAFRRSLLALQASRAELQEDLVWLREWIESQDSNQPVE